jgi:energy-coupling factor transporter transmembrane protein EcfT
MNSTHLQKYYTAHTNPSIKFITHLCPFPSVWLQRVAAVFLRQHRNVCQFPLMSVFIPLQYFITTNANMSLSSTTQSLCKSLIFHISKFLWEEDTTDELHGTVPTIMMTAVFKRKRAVVTAYHGLWRTLYWQHTMLSHVITSYVAICTKPNISLLSTHTTLIHCYTRYTQV